MANWLLFLIGVVLGAWIAQRFILPTYWWRFHDRPRSRRALSLQMSRASMTARSERS